MVHGITIQINVILSCCRFAVWLAYGRRTALLDGDLKRACSTK